MTGKERKAQEQERVEVAEQAQAQWLQEHKAWNWNWPASGSSGGLQRNCWFTNNPKPRRTSKAPGTSHRVVGTQTYYGVPAERKAKRASRRTSPRLQRVGLKFGKAHSYPGKTEGGF